MYAIAAYNNVVERLSLSIEGRLHVYRLRISALNGIADGDSLARATDSKPWIAYSAPFTMWCIW